MEWWPFLIFHRGGLRIKVINNTRVEGIAWNTVARWLERAALSCRRFNSRRITGFAVEELQADEIRSFAGGKDRITWIFAAIEVWSRLWPSTVVGRRSYRNTLALVRDVADRTPALLQSLSFALSPSSPLCRFFGNARHTCVFSHENPTRSPP